MGPRRRDDLLARPNLVLDLLTELGHSMPPCLSAPFGGARRSPPAQRTEGRPQAALGAGNRGRGRRGGEQPSGKRYAGRRGPVSQRRVRPAGAANPFPAVECGLRAA
jgi:hypothetical protein